VRIVAEGLHVLARVADDVLRVTSLYPLVDPKDPSGATQNTNTAAKCIDLTGTRPLMTWDTSVSAGWLGGLAAVIAGVAFTALVLSLQLRPANLPLSKARQMATIFLTCTFIAGIVSAFMYAQVTGEAECTLRTMLLPAASLPLMCLVFGLIVSMEWLVWDLGYREVRSAMGFGYWVAALGACAYVCLVAGNFAAWPEYRSINGRALVVQFAALVLTLLISQHLRKRQFMRTWLAHGKTHYLAVVPTLVAGAGLAAFAWLGSLEIGALPRYHDGTIALTYVIVVGGLFATTTLVRPDGMLEVDILSDGEDVDRGFKVSTLGGPSEEGGAIIALPLRSLPDDRASGA
jgi:hypothetical protein